MKKHLIVLVIVLTSLSVFGQTFTVDGFNYEVISTSPNEVEITGGTNIPPDLIIPGTVSNDGISFSVTSVRGLGNNQLTSVLIPNSVTNIANSAFRFNQLTSIIIPNSVTSIGPDAFGNNQLISVVIPNSVVNIDLFAFKSNQLASVTLGNSVTSIGGFTFADNPSLVVVTSNNPIPPVYATTAFNNTGIRKELTVPEGREEAYTQAGWRSDFFTINGLAEAGTTFIVDGITFQVSTSNPSTLEIIDNTNTGAIIIPSFIFGISVTTIGVNAFRDNSLTSVEIPDSITTIENSAFRNNSLTSIQIPSSVASISAGAFRNNNLTTVFIEEGVTSIEASAFRDNAITSISLPETLTVIRRNAFRNNNSLTSITLPSSVTNMGADIFTGTSLEALTVLSAIPSSIETSSFGGNRNAISVTVPSAGLAAYLASARWANNPENDFFNINEIYTGPIPNTFEQNSIKYNVTGSNPNILEVKGLGVGVDNLSTINIPAIVTERDIVFTPTRIDTDAFNNKNVTTLNVSENLEVIAVRAFANNSDLTSVSLPATLTAIGANAFKNTSLATVTSLNTTPPILQSNSFGDRRGIALTVPTGLAQDYLDANWTGFASIDDGDVDVGDTFESGDFLFEVTSVSPNEVAVIDLISTITSIEIPATVVKSNGAILFTVTSIGEGAFQDKQLTNAIIPDSIIKIEALAFTNSDLSSIIIPDSVTSIGFLAFHSNELTNVVIPDSVTKLDVGAFSVNNITNLVIGSSVRNIKRETFSSNELTSIIIPNNITNIGALSFDGNQLTSIVIPDNVMSIGDFAFRGNELTSVIIGNSVTGISSGAFSDNPLTAVIAEGTIPPAIRGSSFGDRSEIDLTVPTGLIQNYLDAGWRGFGSIVDTDIENRNSENIQEVNRINDVSLFISDRGMRNRKTPEARIKDYVIYNTYGVQVAYGAEKMVSLTHLSEGIHIIHIRFFDAKKVVEKFVR